jgi:protocatechuate 3,4-dioxygenase beta subunit
MNILTAILLLLFQGQPPVQSAAPPPNPADFATVEGTVLWASQARPLEGIPIYLLRDGEAAPEAQRRGLIVTDSSGQFLLKNVPPGEYTVVANRPGHFLESETPIRITVPPKATVRGVVVRMIVGGSISGRIQDPNGTALAGISVSAVQPTYTPTGERVLQGGRGGGGGMTDDRGEYRMRGLRPGSYYVAADANVWASDTRTYYPGTKDDVGAIPLTVREAQDSIANFRVEVKLKPVFTVSGTVTSLVPGVPAKIVERILIATKNGGSTYYDNRADDRTNGRFEMRNIFPDSYELFPEARDVDGRLYTSRTPVEIVDRNIENLTLPAVPVVDVRGLVLLNGERLGNRLPNMNVNLQTIRGLQLGLTQGFVPPPTPGTPPPNPLDRDTGLFTFVAVPPGVYRVTASASPDVYIEDLRQNSVSVYADGFTVTDKPGEPVELLLGSPGGKLSGMVTDLRQQPVPRATVVVVPELTRRQDNTRYRTMVSDKDGKFSFQGLAPGVYKLFAWESVIQNAWRNTEFMSKNENKGKSVTIERGSNFTMQLDLIPREPNQ